jgi:dinuclear metal center YbgI/SA1388 family protein
MATVHEVVAAIERLAPLPYAQDWDNVGLLVEPPGTRVVGRVFLAVDLNAAVFEEAVAVGADFLVLYHPPIFAGLRRLRPNDAMQGLILQAIMRGMPIHSPHTALDAAQGGLNDWLLDAFGAVRDRRPIEPYVDEEPSQGVGAGRVARLVEPLSLPGAVARIKAHLGLERVRVAAAPRHASPGAMIQEVAVCPGAGGSLFEGLHGPDLFLTGEMRHHDVLAKVASGASVVVCDHTNTERGYLPILAQRLQAQLGHTAEVLVSTADRDPLELR